MLYIFKVFFSFNYSYYSSFVFLFWKELLSPFNPLRFSLYFQDIFLLLGKNQIIMPLAWIYQMLFTIIRNTPFKAILNSHLSWSIYISLQKHWWLLSFARIWQCYIIRRWQLNSLKLVSVINHWPVWYVVNIDPIPFMRITNLFF